MRRGRWAAAVSLVLFLATLGVLLRTYVFNSDDVGLQTVLHTWRPGDGDVRVGEDTFLLKAPLYLAANAVGTSKAVLMGTSLLLNGIGWLLLLLGGRSLVRRWSDASAGGPAALWLAGLGGVFASLVLRPNIRNVEFGIAAALLAGLAVLDDRWPADRWRGRVPAMVGLALAIGALAVDDPYFAYVVFVPAAAIVGSASLLVPARRKTAWLVPAVVGLGLAAWQGALVVLDQWGFHPAGEGRDRPAAGELGEAILAALDAVGVVGNGAAGGDGLWWDVRAGANVGALVAMLAAGAWVLARHARRDPWALALAGVPVAALAGHVLSGHSLREGTERYVVLVVVVAAAFAAVGLGGLGQKLRTTLTVGLGVSLALNVAATLTRLDREPVVGNVRDEVVPALSEAGLGRGYADFWYANTITYASDFSIDALPVLCAGGRLEKRLDYVDAARFAERTEPSFYLHDPAYSPCSIPELEAQFGRPARTIRMSLRRRVLVYDYDLAGRLD